MFRALFASSLILFLAITGVQAEGVAVGNGRVTLSGFGNVDLEKTVQLWVDEEAKKLDCILELQLEILTEVCELDDPAIKKLKSSAELLAARRLKSGETQLRAFAVDSELVAAGENETPVGRTTEADTLVPYAAGNLGNGVVRFKSYFKTPILEHPLWVKVMRATLTDQQQDEYLSYIKKRNVSALSSAISMEISQLDEILMFSDRQLIQMLETGLQETQAQLPDTRTVSRTEVAKLARQWADDTDSYASLLRKTQIQRLESNREKQMRSSVSWGSARR